MILRNRLLQQSFPNDYKLVDGVSMHAERGSQFQIPPGVIKRHIRPNQFVELRIDSTRFSVHEDAPEQCSCPSCNGPMSKPILRHQHPASLVDLPAPTAPSRGWGEDFWVRVCQIEDQVCCGIVDNQLIESRLHGLQKNDEVFFSKDHILAVHDSHRRQLVAGMNTSDLKELAQWLGNGGS